MKVLFATGNPGKLKEVKAKFAPLGFEVERLVYEYPELQADTLDEVVHHGLSWLYERHRMPIIIDDSGLFIDGLKGFPGVYSAYVYKTLGCRGILRLMSKMLDRRAEFRCCAGYVDSEGNIITRTGICEGQIIYEMRGEGGFGYDPIFVPRGSGQTFAEMPLDQKNSISHRGKAFEALASSLKQKKPKKE